MQPRHYKQLREIFPELPDGGEIHNSNTFFAFNYRLHLLHQSGTYILYDWSNDSNGRRDLVHSHNFNTFLEKLKKLRKEMEVKTYRKHLTANVIKSSLEDAGYGASIGEPLGERRIIVWAEIPGNDVFNCIGKVRADVWDDLVEVYYGFTKMDNACGDPKYKIPDVVETMIKCLNQAKDHWNGAKNEP